MTEPAQERPMRADARRNRPKVLDAAESVFTTVGPATPMEEVARRAGVGVGTIYRHFPTKELLVEAVVERRFERLADEAEALSDAPDAGTAFFTLFDRMVAESAGKRALSEALAEAGRDVTSITAGSVQRLRAGFAALLERAKRGGAVRPDVDTDQAIGILAGMSLAADHASWDGAQRAHTLAIVFDGLRPR